jgi:hypothetical protein
MKPFWVKMLAAALTAIPMFGSVPKQVERNDILKDEAWIREYDHYVPDGVLLESLKSKMSGTLKIAVYFGFWCDDSGNNVPKVLKILDNLPAPGLKTDYFSVERKANKDQKYYVEGLKIERVPTFIFFRDGSELGRIVENPKTEMLEDILMILF